MSALFVAAIRNLEIFGDLGSGDKFSDSFKITNNKKFIKELLPKWCESQIGQLEINGLLSGCAVVYSKVDKLPNVSPFEYLVDCLHHVDLFLGTLWITVDNAAVVENGFLICSNSDRSEVHENFLASKYFNCAGLSDPIGLTRDELRRVRELIGKVIDLRPKSSQKALSEVTDGNSLLTRTLYFLKQARSSSDLAIKITHYCTTFETLFATSQAELSHQLAERISSFLYQEVDDRLSAFRSIKEAYGVRSKVVHGDTIKSGKIGDLLRIARYCDSIARQVLYRIWTEPSTANLFELDNSKFDEAMLRLTFGGTMASHQDPSWAARD